MHFFNKIWIICALAFTIAITAMAGVNVRKQADSSIVKIAVVLPFKSDKGEGIRCLEFYRGLLMSTEQFKQQGSDIRIYAFDEGNPSDSIGHLLSKIDSLKVDLLISPLYFSHFESVSKFSLRTGVKVIVPFSSKVIYAEHTPDMYLINTPVDHETEEIRKLVDIHIEKPYYIFLNHHKGNKNEFVSHLQKRLDPSNYKMLSPRASSCTDSVYNELVYDYENIIIPNASNEETLLKTLKLIDEIKSFDTETTVSVMGYPEWGQYLKEHPIERLSKSIYFFTNSYYNSYATDVQDFEMEYRKWFNQELLTTTPKMGLLGYDCGTFFIDGIIRNGKDFDNQPTYRSMLQSPFKFRRINKKGGSVNTNIWLMHYSTDGTFEKLGR